ncbi:hypothetical protein BT93_H1509 [Corymbia citriodora subsp. variegata]|nr:hypothetical protein BT93_H1509 [Corymbia citriodora subsp. variegata]
MDHLRLLHQPHLRVQCSPSPPLLLELEPNSMVATGRTQLFNEYKATDSSLDEPRLTHKDHPTQP